MQENSQSWKQNKIKIMQMIKKLFENAHGHDIIVIVFFEERNYNEGYLSELQFKLGTI